MNDLVERNDLHHEKFTNVPFTGEISGKKNGSFRKGKKNGGWLVYYGDGQLEEKGYVKDEKAHGLREYFNEDGSLKRTETYKNGVKVGD